MKTVLLACLALLFVTLGSTAEARRGAIPHGEFSQFDAVSKTRIPGIDGSAQTLCHHTRKSHVAHIGWWRENLGYVLSSHGCDPEQRTSPITPQALRRAKENGFVPLSVASEPTLTLSQVASGFTAWLILGPLALLRILGLLRGLVGRPRGRSLVAARSLEVMCEVAKADGQIDGSEIEVIGFAIEQLLGSPPPDAQIRDALAKARPSFEPAILVRHARGLDSRQKRAVLRAALLVAVADGRIEEAEYAYVSALAQIMGVGGGDLRAMLQQVSALIRTSAGAGPGSHPSAQPA